MIRRGYLTAFVSAFLFALGLGIGGMTDPAKVIGFLDFTGDWNPALMGVMGGAVTVYLVLHRLILRMHRPVFHDVFSMPSKTKADPRLLTGAAIFGVGWGMAGICPGPALTSLASGSAGILVFVGAMLAGFLAVPVGKPSAAARPSQVELEVPAQRAS